MSIKLFSKLTVCFAVLTSLSLMADDTNIIQQLSRRYKSANTEIERRSICLEAIDREVIKRGVPIADVKAIFGADFWQDIGKDAEGRSYGVVHFVTPQESGPDDPGLLIGWYLAVYYSDGFVYKYYLTNLHK